MTASTLQPYLALRSAVCVLLLVGTAGAAMRMGDRWQPLALADAQGQATQLTAPASGVLLVEMWASWCAPCREALPALAALSAQYASKGLQVALINIDQEHAAAERFLSTLLPDRGAMMLLVDPGGVTMARLGAPGMPVTFVIVDGVVDRVGVGFDAAQREAIERVLRQRMPEKSGAP